jgi:hypothetical protein
MYDRADASLANATGSWHALQKHQRIFASCDDGALAEGYSDAVVKLLANHWERFPVFAALSQRDPAFRRWAIRHIDSSAASDDLKRVVRHAQPASIRCKRSSCAQALIERRMPR